MDSELITFTNATTTSWAAHSLQD